MIDKWTINREIFLPIMPKEEDLKLRKKREKKESKILASLERHPWLWTMFGFALFATLFARLLEGDYYDMDCLLSAMLMMPEKAFEWARAIPLEKFVNTVYLPTLVLIAFIFIVAKLKPPTKKD